jgi:2-amino-4-hydroxy-6-hydroxymethyldihydropteridine diphosphokinase
LTVAVLGLGGNVGDRLGNLAQAIERLSVHPSIQIAAVSALYETPPWGKTDQPAFLNAAIRIETELSARALLDVALEVERRLGRERGERWGPRTVDIDILLFGPKTIAEPGLHVPHPRLHERAFALAPLVDVLPEATIAGKPATEWLALADSAGMTRLASPGWERQAGQPAASPTNQESGARVR